MPVGSRWRELGDAVRQVDPPTAPAEPAVASVATDYYEVVRLACYGAAIPGPVSGRFSSLFLLALSAGGLMGALAARFLECPWGLTVTLGILALPVGVLAVPYSFAARHREQSRPSPMR